MGKQLENRSWTVEFEAQMVINYYAQTKKGREMGINFQISEGIILYVWCEDEDFYYTIEAIPNHEEVEQHLIKYCCHYYLNPIKGVISRNFLIDIH